MLLQDCRPSQALVHYIYANMAAAAAARFSLGQDRGHVWAMSLAWAVKEKQSLMSIGLLPFSKPYLSYKALHKSLTVWTASLKPWLVSPVYTRF